jgi:hypothetical protein
MKGGGGADEMGTGERGLVPGVREKELETWLYKRTSPLPNQTGMYRHKVILLSF